MAKVEFINSLDRRDRNQIMLYLYLIIATVCLLFVSDYISFIGCTNNTAHYIRKRYFARKILESTSSLGVINNYRTSGEYFYSRCKTFLQKEMTFEFFPCKLIIGFFFIGLLAEHNSILVCP
jgi:hypothetical protein